MRSSSRRRSSSSVGSFPRPHRVIGDGLSRSSSLQPSAVSLGLAGSLVLQQTTDRRGVVADRYLQTQWLEEHARKIGLLMADLQEIAQRLEHLGSMIDERIQTEGYLALVRRAFRAWDRADTEEKRTYIRNLISNAAGTRLCSDDVFRLFIDWLDLYHEAHFAVIREIYKNPGSSRFLIWDSIYGDLPQEDSAEADLYRLLIRDLSTGGVIRQERETNEYGQFLRKKTPRRRGRVPPTMESAFEETKPYVLTQLGRQFVHYTMNEVVLRLQDGANTADGTS